MPKQEQFGGERQEQRNETPSVSAEQKESPQNDTAYSNYAQNYFNRRRSDWMEGKENPSDEDLKYQKFLDEQRRTLANVANYKLVEKMHPKEATFALSELAGMMANNMEQDPNITIDQNREYSDAKKIFMATCQKMFTGVKAETDGSMPYFEIGKLKKIGIDAGEIKEQIDDMPVPEFSSYEKENRPPLPPADDLAKLYSAIATIKIINPLLQLGTKELWKGAVESLKELKNLNDSKDSRKVETLTSLAFYMKIADPSFDVDDAIGNAGWENIQKSFYGFKNIDFAAKIKVINPKIDLKLNEGDWQLMKENLSKARTEKNYYVVDGFTPLAATMKILAADKTIITDKGLEIK